MRIARGILVGLALALATPGGPAFAACTEDLKKVKEEFARLHDVRKKDQVRKQISAADTALKRRNESGCKRAVADANKILKQRP